MKKFIINIIVFFGIVAAIDVCVGFTGDYFYANAKGGSTKEFNDLALIDYHDIIILGSSRANHHYDTPFLSDTLGLDVYNAGYSGNGVILADGILELVLTHSRPKLILLDIEPAFDIIVYEKDNNHKRYISYLKPYYQTAAIGNIIKDVSEEEWYKVHSGMIRYNTTFIRILMDNIITRENNPKGYSPLSGAILEEREPSSPPQYEIDSFKLKYVSDLIDLAKKNQIQIALVASPKYGEREYSILEPVIKICEEKEIPFWNYYIDSAFMNHKEWFKEPMHINATGARVFSRMIVPKIEELIITNENSNR